MLLVPNHSHLQPQHIASTTAMLILVLGHLTVSQWSDLKAERFSSVLLLHHLQRDFHPDLATV
uniref:Uncharacterized protein n=1 Tax=Lotus japonicus TaxID=34305 RepID=I3S2M2_LOTJA|nr:unknown [Lotus japonicus]